MSTSCSSVTISSTCPSTAGSCCVRTRSRWRLGCSRRWSAARTALTAYLESGASAYGVTTGLGFLANRELSDVDHAAFQRSILAGRAAGFGPPLSEAVVRGAMLLRLTGFLSGHAGVTAALCRSSPIA